MNGDAFGESTSSAFQRGFVAMTLLLGEPRPSVRTISSATFEAFAAGERAERARRIAAEIALLLGDVRATAWS